jgi:uncharacterized protein (TIGR02145 family)
LGIQIFSDRHLEFRILENMCWWSSTENDEEIAWCPNLYYSSSLVYRESFGKGYGFSVRCIKDAAVDLIPR